MYNKECIFCGEILEKKGYTCESCANKMELLLKIKKLDNAKDKMRKGAKKFAGEDYDYEEERDSVAMKILLDNFQFNSTEEACVAMQLEKENIKYYPNYKIGRYMVDFLLPDLKIIIEVDGKLYHKDETKEFFRERYIMSAVGEKYEIVRIKAENIPGGIAFGIKPLVNFIIKKRNNNFKFRDTSCDSRYLYDFLSSRKRGNRK